MPALKLSGGEDLARRFDRLGGDVRACILAASRTLAAKLQAHVLQDKLAGQVLERLTGDLAASITTTVEVTDVGVTAAVFSASPPPYAAILELGGVIPAHDIVPVSAEALSFVIEGHRVFARIAHIPEIAVAPHAYLHGALQDMAADIAADLQEATARALDGRSS